MQGLKQIVSDFKEEFTKKVIDFKESIDQKSERFKSDMNVISSSEFNDSIQAVKILLDKLNEEVQPDYKRSSFINVSLLRQYHLKVYQQYEEASKNILIKDEKLFKEWLFWAQYSEAGYLSEKAEIAGALNIPVDDILIHDLIGESHMCPKYFITRNESLYSIILTIRGTKSLSDFVTDMKMDTIEFLGGVAHRGIYEGTLQLFQRIKIDIEKLFFTYKDYQLVINGHSLGGGTSICLALFLLQKQKEEEFLKNVKIRCIAFAPPPVYLGCSSPEMNNCIDVVINAEDVIPTASMKALYYLGLELREIDCTELDNFSCLQYIIRGQNPEKFEKMFEKLNDSKINFQKQKTKFAGLHQVGNLYYMYLQKNGQYICINEDKDQFIQMKLLPSFVNHHLMSAYIHAIKELAGLSPLKQKESSFYQQMQNSVNGFASKYVMSNLVDINKGIQLCSEQEQLELYRELKYDQRYYPNQEENTQLENIQFFTIPNQIDGNDIQVSSKSQNQASETENQKLKKDLQTETLSLKSAQDNQIQEASKNQMQNEKQDLKNDLLVETLNDDFLEAFLKNGPQKSEASQNKDCKQHDYDIKSAILKGDQTQLEKHQEVVFDNQSHKSIQKNQTHNNVNDKSCQELENKLLSVLHNPILDEQEKKNFLKKQLLQIHQQSQVIIDHDSVKQWKERNKSTLDYSASFLAASYSSIKRNLQTLHETQSQKSEAKHQQVNTLDEYQENPKNKSQISSYFANFQLGASSSKDNEQKKPEDTNHQGGSGITTMNANLSYLASYFSSNQKNDDKK